VIDLLPYKKMVLTKIFFSLPPFANNVGKTDEEDDKKVQTPEEAREEERIEDLGRPRLGDITRITVNIRESMEFKVGSPIHKSVHRYCVY